MAQTAKNPPAMQETWVWSLHQEDPLEKGMVAHSSVLAWRIPWTEGCGQMVFLSQNGDLVLISKRWNSCVNNWSAPFSLLWNHVNAYACGRSFSHVQLSATPWTVARQAPLSLGFSSKSTGVGCHFLLHRIFLTQGSNSHLSPLISCNVRHILYHCATFMHPSQKESILIWKAELLYG